MTPKERLQLFIWFSFCWTLSVLIFLAALNCDKGKEKTIGNALAERRIHQVHP